MARIYALLTELLAETDTRETRHALRDAFHELQRLHDEEDHDHA